MTESKKPIDTLRLPGGIKATTWLNTSESGKTFTTTSITRTFKTDGGFRDSHAFTHDELLKVAKAATEAFDRITAIKNDRKSEKS